MGLFCEIFRVDNPDKFKTDVTVIIFEGEVKILINNINVTVKVLDYDYGNPVPETIILGHADRDRYDDMKEDFSDQGFINCKYCGGFFSVKHSTVDNVCPFCNHIS